MSPTLNTATPVPPIPEAKPIVAIRQKPKNRWGKSKQRPPSLQLRVTRGGKVLIRLDALAEGYEHDKQKGTLDIFEFFEDLDVDLNIMGIKVSPTVIVKIYCKLNNNQRDKLLHQDALEKAAEGSPMLW
jgi:hypothetical protein